MKKFCLSLAGVLLMLFSGFAQNTPKDSSQYKPRKLTFEEANFVSSYYNQTGNNSAVTGGIGTEKLTDLSGSFDVKFFKYDRKQRKNSFDFEIGIDHYTSASSDKINPASISSASYADTRIYPSLNWTRENETKGTTIGAGISASSEFDYKSLGVNLYFAKKTADKNGEFSAKLQGYLDNLKIILPVELRPPADQNDDIDESSYPTEKRNSFSGSFSYSQILNQRLQIMFIADLIYQQGYLGLPFHRVYFDNNVVKVENLPETRLKIPLGFRANYFIGDKMIIRSFYRYYKDDWGLSSHTIDLEAPVKITPFFSITPFYRYYNQTAVDYFKPYHIHKAADQYYTSNYDLSKFSSNFYGAGFRIAPPNGVFGSKHINMLELRYGHYNRSNGLQSNIVTLHLKFK
jgi:hypothetical protein